LAATRTDRLRVRAMWAVVGALVLLALLLRVWGARFGLPEYVYHPDEHALVERAATILRTGDYSPHWFNYPSLYIYVQACGYIPYFLISAARGFGNTIPDPAPYGFYLTGRLITGFLGALTVLAVYSLGARMYERKIGLISSALLAFSLLHVVHSHYATTDLPVGLAVVISLLFCQLTLQKRELKYTMLAGLFAGLSASIKYPGAVAIVPALSAQLLISGKRTWTTLGQRLGLCVGSFVAGFLLGTPYAFLELNTFLSSLASVVGHYGATQPGFEGLDAGLWYLQQALTSADAPLVAVGIAGIAWAALKRRRGDLLLLSFVVPYYLLISLWRVRFERNLVALFPILTVLAGRLLVDMVSWLLKRRPALRRWDSAILAGAVAVIVIIPGKAVLDFDSALARKDPRTVAAEWVNANIPAGSRIVVEAFAIPIEWDHFRVTHLVRIDSEPAEWYEEEDIDFVVVSDGHWRILFRQPEQHQRELATYEEILSRSMIVRGFPATIPTLLNQGYPTIAVYHFPDVLILRLD
jgi:4-amino-4-deoxy-L-arabinose transferase-like glycosyltransferase